MNAEALRAELRALGSPEKAKASAWFFKTGPGQYGEGDVFVGVTVPEQRKVAKRYLGLSAQEVEELLHSPEHEFRLTAVMLWAYQFGRGNEVSRKSIYQFYLANTRWINNWDLVDAAAAQIVGAWLEDKDHSVLDRLAESESLWERRIAIVATHWFIKRGQPDDTLRIADALIVDKHDLIQKATGWMLREVGKHCGQAVEEAWLASRYRAMPRTMLRYAIERFEPERRQQYLKGWL